MKLPRRIIFIRVAEEAIGKVRTVKQQVYTGTHSSTPHPCEAVGSSVHLRYCWNNNPLKGILQMGHLLALACDTVRN